MAPDQYRAALQHNGLSHAHIARLLGVDRRTSERWAAGTRAIPGPVWRLVLACVWVPGLQSWLENMNGEDGDDA